MEALGEEEVDEAEEADTESDAAEVSAAANAAKTIMAEANVKRILECAGSECRRSDNRASGLWMG
jgi:hypothetical protein